MANEARRFTNNAGDAFAAEKDDAIAVHADCCDKCCDYTSCEYGDPDNCCPSDSVASAFDFDFDDVNGPHGSCCVFMGVDFWDNTYRLDYASPCNYAWEGDNDDYIVVYSVGTAIKFNHDDGSGGCCVCLPYAGQAVTSQTGSMCAGSGSGKLSIESDPGGCDIDFTFNAV